MSSSPPPSPGRLSRRRLLGLAALTPLTAQLLGACASRAAGPTPSATPSLSPTPTAEPSALTTLEVTTLADVTDSLPSALSACDELGTALLAHSLETNPRTNALVAPLSLSLILALLADGATDPVAQGYDAALGSLGAQRDRTWSAIQASVLRNDRSLNGFSPENPPTKPMVHLANHVVFLDDAQAHDAYLQAVRHWYSAEVVLLPRETAQKRMDAWASLHTGALIPQSGGLDDTTQLVMQNALLFSARWLNPFLPENTTIRPFTLDDATTTNAAFMWGSQALPYAQGEGWEAVRLPYLGGQAPVEDDAASVGAGGAGGTDGTDGATVQVPGDGASGETPSPTPITPATPATTEPATTAEPSAPSTTGEPGASAAEQPPALVLDVIVPAAGTLPAQMDASTWAAASAALDSAAAAQVDLYLPKADLAPSEVDLTEFLKARGLEMTDFDAISPKLSRVNVTQQIHLTLDEVGTVAAALTEASATPAATLPAESAVSLDVNRPFAVRLRDLVSGVTLLQAVIMDPTSKTTTRTRNRETPRPS